jgi:hypothetical protein
MSKQENISLEDNIYMAGLVDSGSSITICLRTRYNRLKPKFSISSKYEELVGWIKSIYGGNVSSSIRDTLRNTTYYIVW